MFANPTFSSPVLHPPTVVETVICAPVSTFPLFVSVTEQPHSQTLHFPASLAATSGHVCMGCEQGCVLALHLVLPPFHRLEHRRGAEAQLQP